MKPTINNRQTACRLLAGLFFFLLLVPMAAGEEASPPPTYWKEHVANKIANDNGGDGTVGKPILIATAEELA